MKNKYPLVSVVIPCYNHEQFVQQTIQSVIDQTYENIELIIIDDGSKDDSVVKIQEFIDLCEKRFTRFEFRSRPNKGLSSTLNEALEWCEGKLYAPIASDDILMPYKTEIQVNEFLKYKDKNVVAIFAAVKIFTKDVPLTPDLRAFNTRKYGFDDVFLRRSKLPAPTAMIVTEKVRQLNGYNVNTKIEDLDLWLKLTNEGGNLLYIDIALAFYRRHPENNSKNDKVMFESMNNILEGYSYHRFYEEALLKSCLVHAGDLIQDKNLSAFKYLLYALKRKPRLAISKLSLVFFYRGLLGVLNRKD